MDFSNNYELTARYINAIRYLSSVRSAKRRSYKLKTVKFDRLRKISSPAALVLTAELSKWDDRIRNQLKPEVSDWAPEVVNFFNELGYFDLFADKPELKCQNTSNLKLVKYIKGSCGDSSKMRDLRDAVKDMVGKDIDKWMFLRSGLDEAITNVSHHAYPNSEFMCAADKAWYVTGAYDAQKNELKIIFYDQGIGIPKSLPASEISEKVYAFIEKLGLSTKIHSTLIKGAVELDRTSTGESDRGKGLQDLLEFIKQRQEGYLSIFSLKGLYKYSISGGKASTKTENFKTSIPGTVIIWNVQLL